jgi:hypothetical protein
LSLGNESYRVLGFGNKKFQEIDLPHSDGGSRQGNLRKKKSLRAETSSNPKLPPLRVAFF